MLHPVNTYIGKEEIDKVDGLNFSHNQWQPIATQRRMQNLERKNTIFQNTCNMFTHFGRSGVT